MQDEKARWVMGKRALEELSKWAIHRIVNVYTSRCKDPLTKKLKGMGIKVSVRPDSFLRRVVQSDSHQGFAAQVVVSSECCASCRSSTYGGGYSLFIACDGITDPQNFGAILRAAESFGVNGAIYQSSKAAQITSSVSKASAGASELIPLIKVPSLVVTLREFVANGYKIISSDPGTDGRSLYSFQFPQKAVLVMGSEGFGIRESVRKLSKERVSIPMVGKIASLNVSQAASIFLSVWASQHSEKLS